MRKTKVKIIVQGGDECAADFEARINELLDKLDSSAIVMGTASASGRMTLVINYEGPHIPMINDDQIDIPFDRSKDEYKDLPVRDDEHRHQTWPEQKHKHERPAHIK